MSTEFFQRSPTTARRILFLEENVSYFEMLRKVFSAWARDSWQFLHASNPGKALALLDDHLVDLVVLDHRVSAIEGLQFARLMSQRHPSIRKAVLTAEPDEQKKTAFFEAGIDVYLEKPSSMEGMEGVFRTLNELASWHSEKGFRGVLHGLKLQTVLQIVCFGANSGVVEIFSGATRGEVYIEHGFVVHASVAGFSGKDALGLLFSFEEGSFKLSPFAAPSETTLSLGWDALMQDFPVPQIAAPQLDVLQSTDDSPEAIAHAHDGAADATADSLAAITEEDLSAPRIEELLLCTLRGDVLHQIGCAEPEKRYRFLENLARKSEELGTMAALGRFNRVEIEAQEARALMHIRPTGFVFLQARRAAEEIAI